MGFTAVVTVVVANPVVANRVVYEDVVDEDVRDKDEIHFISISFLSSTQSSREYGFLSLVFFLFLMKATFLPSFFYISILSSLLYDFPKAENK